MGCCNSDKSCASGVAIQLEPASKAPAVPADAARLVLVIRKMDCPTEEKLIRDRFQNAPGILGLQFSLMERELTVSHNLASGDSIVEGLEKLGLDPVVKSDSLDMTRTDEHDHHDLSADYRIPLRTWILMGISGVTAISSEVVAWTTGNENSWPVIALADRKSVV